MKRTKYSPGYAASIIADSEYHSFKKHVVDSDMAEWLAFRNFGVHDENSFRKHILETINSRQTVAFKAIDNRDVYYNRKTNTFVAVDMNNPEGGTCFIPTKGRNYFIEQIQLDVEKRAEYTRKNPLSKIRPRPSLRRGYNSLYNSKNKEKINEFKKINRLKIKTNNELKKDIIRKESAKRRNVVHVNKSKQVNLVREQIAKQKAAEKAKINQLKQMQAKAESEQKRRLEERKRQLEIAKQKAQEAKEAQFRQNQRDITKNYDQK